MEPSPCSLVGPFRWASQSKHRPLPPSPRYEDATWLCGGQEPLWILTEYAVVDASESEAWVFKLFIKLMSVQGRGCESRCFMRGPPASLQNSFLFPCSRQEQVAQFSNPMVWSLGRTDVSYKEGMVGEWEGRVGSSLFLQLLTLLPLCCGDLGCFGSSSFSLSRGPIVSSILVGTHIYFVFPALGSSLFTCSLRAFTLSCRPILPTVYAMMSCVLRLLHSDPIIIKSVNFLQVTWGSTQRAPLLFCLCWLTVPLGQWLERTSGWDILQVAFIIMATPFE